MVVSGNCIEIGELHLEVTTPTKMGHLPTLKKHKGLDDTGELVTLSGMLLVRPEFESPNGS